MKKRKTPQKKSSGINSLLLGILVNTVTLISAALIFAVIAYATGDPLGVEKPLSLAALLAGGAVSGFIVAKKSEKAYTPVLSLGANALLLLLFGIIISGNVPRLGSVINLAIYVAVGAVSSKLGGLSFGKKRFRR